MADASGSCFIVAEHSGEVAKRKGFPAYCYFNVEIKFQSAAGSALLFSAFDTRSQREMRQVQANNQLANQNSTGWVL